MSTDPHSFFLNEDLDWLAFCYINDELQTNELASFERRLSEDQAARDAVERAVNQQILISASLHAGCGRDITTQVESNGLVSISPRREHVRNSGSKHRLLVPKFVFAAATLLIALVSWAKWGHLIQTQTIELADLRAVNSDFDESEDWFTTEEFANPMVDAMVDALVETKGSEDEFSTDGEVTPAALQADWMQDVFSEIGDEWNELEDTDESDFDSTESDWSWG